MKKRMKRILSVLFASAMIFGIAANASAGTNSLGMGKTDFVVMTLNETQGLETVDTFGPTWTSYASNPAMIAPGTTIQDMFTIDNFAGSTNYAELDTIAVSTFNYLNDWTGQRAWIAINEGATPHFDPNPGVFQTAYNQTHLFHMPDSTPEMKTFGDAGQGLYYGGLQPQFLLGGFENNGVANINLANILTEDYTMNIWQLDATVEATGNIMNWEKTDLNLRIYNSGGTALGDERIDATIVNAVPIPGAIWLLGSGILAMVGVRRKRS